MPKLNRRQFLVRAAAGGGMALGFHLPPGGSIAGANDAGAEINAWIVIRPDDTVAIRVAPSEMGQGIFTALPMLVAEELECDWVKVRPEFASPSESFARKRPWGDMSTGASRSVLGSHQTLLRAGATAREMLIAAAAARWSVPAAECKAANSVVTHGPSGRKLGFGAVAADAARLRPPTTVALKPRKDWKLAGTRQRRAEVPNKVQGKPVYGIDVRLPGMLYAAIVHGPVFGGKVQRVDSSKAEAVRGVRRIVKLADAVAVVSESWWQANRAASLLEIAWDDQQNRNLSSQAIERELQLALTSGEHDIGRKTGDAAAALRNAVTRVEAEYALPFLAHATMEPPNCTAWVRDGRVDVWAPTQDAELALSTAAETAGVAREQATVHRTMLGGGFGRSGPVQDFLREAVLIAKEVGQPVQLLWSREEDVRHDFYRPPALARLTAGLDANGMPTAWSMRIAGQSLMLAFAPDIPGAEVEPVFLEAFVETWPYDVPNLTVEYALRNAPVPIGALRGIYQVPNVFFRECFIDEIAHAGRHDPLELRRKLCAKRPRHLAVLDAVAKSVWHTPAPRGVFRGLAINESAQTLCAQVAEVSVSERGELRVHRVVSVIDPGIAVNPLTIELQTQGAVAFALSAALYGDITVKNGQVEQSNFHDYEILRLRDMPRVETVIVENGGSCGGVGEQAVAPLAPALCNAVFAATGRRIRKLPLNGQDLRGRAANAG